MWNINFILFGEKANILEQIIIPTIFSQRFDFW